MFERPFKVGDTVQVGGVEGKVGKINIRATTVHTYENVALLVPNKEFIAQTVVNVRHTDPKTRLTIKVGAGYGSTPVNQLNVTLALQNPTLAGRSNANGSGIATFSAPVSVIMPA